MPKEGYRKEFAAALIDPATVTLRGEEFSDGIVTLINTNGRDTTPPTLVFSNDFEAATQGVYTASAPIPMDTFR